MNKKTFRNTAIIFTILLIGLTAYILTLGFSAVESEPEPTAEPTAAIMPSLAPVPIETEKPDEISIIGDWVAHNSTTVYSLSFSDDKDVIKRYKASSASLADNEMFDLTKTGTITKGTYTITGDKIKATAGGRAYNYTYKDDKLVASDGTEYSRVAGNL